MCSGVTVCMMVAVEGSETTGVCTSLSIAIGTPLPRHNNAVPCAAAGVMHVAASAAKTASS